MTGASLLSPRRAGGPFAAGASAFAARALRAAAGTSTALLLGAAFVAGGAPAAGADTLTFSFSDDGRNSTITASGSLDLSAGKRSSDYQTGGRGLIGLGNWVSGSAGSYYVTLFLHGEGRRTVAKYQGWTITVSGLDSFREGGADINKLTAYKSDIYFNILDSIRFDDPEKCWCITVEAAKVKDNIYNPTGSKITFAGTLLKVFGDNDFHIEYSFGSNKIILKSVPSTQAEERAVKHTLAAVAQATLDGAVDTIGQRLDVPSGRASLTLAGRQVGGMTALPAEKGNWWDRIDRWDGKSAAGSAGSQAVSPSALLGGSAFVLPLAAAADRKGRAAGAKLAVWGRGDYRSFAGQRRGERWDGRQWTGWLGVDGKLDRRLTAGVALSHGQGRADYRLDQFKGRVATSLTALWPYLQMKLARGGAVRLVLGAGRGRAEHRKFDGEAEKADLTMLAASASGRQPVARWGRIVLSTLAGASVAQIRTKGSPSTAIGGLRARSWRLRGGVEAEHDGLALSSRRNAPRLRPRLGLAVRQDGGDGVRGTGMELTGGVRLSRPGVRLVLDASGHWLALHGQSGTREWGASVAVRLVPRAGGRGLSLALGVERGSPRTGVLNREAAFASEAAEQPGRMLLSLRTGYGFALAGGVLTPFADMAFGTGDVRTRRYRTGIGFRRDGLEAALTAAHRRGSTAETRVDLDLRLSY